MMAKMLKIVAVFYMLAASGNSTDYNIVPKVALYDFLTVPERCALSAACHEEYERALSDIKHQVMIILHKEGFKSYPTLEFFSWGELKSLLDIYQKYRSGRSLNNPLLAERRELQNRMELVDAQVWRSMNYVYCYEAFAPIIVVAMAFFLGPFICSLPFDVGSPRIITVYSCGLLSDYPFRCVPEKVELDFPWDATFVGIGLLLSGINMIFKHQQHHDEKESGHLKFQIMEKNLDGLNNSIATSKQFLIELGRMLRREFLWLKSEEILKLENDIRKLDHGPFHQIWNIIGLNRREQFRYAE